MKSLFAGGREISYADVEAGNYEDLSLYFICALDFCRDWLSGRQKFTINTSGSTGQPKPVILQRKHMQESTRLTAGATGIKPGTRSLVCINTAYIGGIMMMVRSLELGLEMHLFEPGSDPLAEVGANELPGFTAMVPMQLQNALDHWPDKLKNIPAVIVGGTLIPPALADRIRDLPNKIWHTYGMTETCSHIALKLMSTPAHQQHFYPLPGYALRVDERGCLCISGPVTDGNWLATNDRVQLYPDGGFDVLGRVDDIINSGGVKIDPGKVEEIIASLLGSKAPLFFCAGIPDPQLGQKLVLVIEGDTVGEKQLHSLPSLLPPYHNPREIVHVNRMVLTGSGKIDKAATMKALNR